MASDPRKARHQRMFILAILASGGAVWVNWPTLAKLLPLRTSSGSSSTGVSGPSAEGNHLLFVPPQMTATSSTTQTHGQERGQERDRESAPVLEIAPHARAFSLDESVGDPFLHPNPSLERTGTGASGLPHTTPERLNSDGRPPVPRDTGERAQHAPVLHQIGTDSRPAMPKGTGVLENAPR